MADYRNRHGNDAFGFDVEEGLGFSFNRSGVREFIRANRKGVVTHRLFIYQNGSSPGQIVLDEGDALVDDLPLMTPEWQELGNAPERRGHGAIPITRREKATARGGGASGASGGAGGGGAGGGGAGGDEGRRLGRWISRSAVGADRGADGSPALARGGADRGTNGSPALARGGADRGADGSPLLTEDTRHRYRHRTRKNKQK
jgi:hypothetical protein